MPFTNIILNPKYFDCYTEMENYIFSIINNPAVVLEDIKISRIDVAADIADINVKAIIAMLHVKGVKAFRIIEDTIYAGKNPKVRIYNKLNEIKNRIKKDLKVAEGEKTLLESFKDLTRFEVAISRPKINIRQLKENPLGLVSYFDRLNFIELSCSNPCGVMQIMYKQVNRKFRKQLEALRNVNLVAQIKETYISDVTEWFKEREPF
ncbi:MAG: hypothetical protein WA126_04915 [Thermodesulfovibrionales bacterium]